MLSNKSPQRAALLLVVAALYSCNNKTGRDLVSDDSKTVKEPPAANYHAGPLAGNISTPSGAAASVNVPAASNRPSTEDNMGRGFQGVMQLRIDAKNHPPSTLRFMSLGNASRLQAQGSRAFDLLFLDGDVLVMDHDKRVYHSKSLPDLRERGETSDVKSENLGTSQTIEKVPCTNFKLSDGPLRIEACAAGLPGEFSAGKFEAASGMRVPGWVRKLLADEYLPVLARVHDAAGKEVYSLRLESYGPGPIHPVLLAIPSDYRRM